MTQRFIRQLFTADALGIIFVIAALQIVPIGIAASVPDGQHTIFFSDLSRRCRHRLQLE